MARRSYLQFSLRSLFLALTVAGIWLGVVVNSARQQREAVSALRKRHWRFRYDHETASRMPRWLQERIGVDLFSNVVEGRDGNWPGRLTNGDLSHLSALRHLKSLHLNLNSEVSETSVASLGKLSELVELILWGDVSKDALRHIVKLPNLRRLSLSDSRITVSESDTNREWGEAPFRRQNLPSLRQLEMLRTSGAEIALAELGALPQLRSADLRKCNLTDDALVLLAGWRSIEELDLSNNPLGDQGLVHLRSLTTLTSLRLDYTDVSNKCLDHVAPLANLKLFTVQRTWVTADAIQVFQESHPATKLGWRENPSYFDVWSLSWKRGPDSSPASNIRNDRHGGSSSKR